jgi:hypothetical protein
VGQIGEFLVCAQLGKRGLIATPFSGNVPAFDILATDEHCRTVPIQVKSSRSDNWPSDARTWMQIQVMDGRQVGLDGSTPLVATAITHADLIYVCVIIGDPGKPDRYFVLTKSELQIACIKGYNAWMEPKNWRRPRNPESYDCRYGISSIAEYEDNWSLIEARLNSLPIAAPSLY